ncbi:MAG: sugar phosphate isomerase/epimerase [Jiangellaceae bacterium]
MTGLDDDAVTGPINAGLTEADLAGRLGIFARTFRRDAIAEVASAVANAGYAMAHWNFAAVGRSTLAADVDEALFDEVRTVFDAAGLTIPSVSATFNVIHPDRELRAVQTVQAVRLIGLAPQLGTDMVVTLCTGTRDPDNMWRAHPENTTAEAWTDLRRTLDVLLAAAAEAGVILGVEPEHANVVRDAPTAARLLTELGANAPVGIIFDAANLLSPDTINRQDEILSAAVDLLGPRVVGAQAKDVVASGYSAAGTGLMNYPAAFAALATMAPMPVIVQDATEDDAARVRADLIRWHAEGVQS